MSKIDINKIDNLEAHSFNIKILEIIEEAFDIFKKNSGIWMLSTLVFIAATIILNMIPFIGQITLAVLVPTVIAGAYHIVEKMQKEENIEKEDFFIYIQDPLHFFLAHIISYSFITIGLFLCLLPGIFISVCYIFTIPILMEMDEKNFWEAMEASRKLVMKNWVNVFLFSLVLILLLIGGFLLCGVGIVVTFPLVIIMIKLSYNRIKEEAGLATDETKSDYLNDFDSRY